jgi:uncharacterized membrane protein
MKFVSLALLLIAFALALTLYPRLPDPMPSHWNMAGELDGWSPKVVGVFLLPMVMLMTVVLFRALPAMSPVGYPVDETSRAYRAIEAATVAFSFCIYVALLLTGLGVQVEIGTLMSVLAGALFIVLGNYMTKMRRNFFIGIRTPWTLANEDVWFRTHRLGGKTFVIGGIALLLVPFAGLPATAVAFPVIGLSAALVPAVYSYVIYRRMQPGLEKGEVE